MHDVGIYAIKIIHNQVLNLCVMICSNNFHCINSNIERLSKLPSYNFKEYSFCISIHNPKIHPKRKLKCACKKQ